MSATALETTRLWLATLADPLAIVVFGTILLGRLARLRAEMREELRAGFEKIERAINVQTVHVLRVGREQSDRP